MQDSEHRVLAPKLRPPRVASFVSSRLEGFCGVQAFADALAVELRHVGTSMLPVDVADASLFKVGRLVRKVAQTEPDVVSLQYPSETFGRGFLPHLFSLVQRVAPLVITLHEFSQLHPLRRLGLMLLFLRASMVISTTEPERRQLERWNPWLKGRTRIIPICNFMPAREWQPENPPSVVYLGQIRPAKGLEEFFACFDRLSSVRFAIIGSSVPKFASYYDVIAAQAAQRGIPIISGLTDDEVSDQLAKATVALLPFPDGATLRRSSLLAAAGCGVPLVTRTGPDTPGSLARLLTPADTVEEFTDLISTLLQNPSLRHQSHLQSLELNRLAGWEPVARDYLAAFQTVSG